MKHVFISYVHENSEQVQRLADYLTSQGVKVWLDKNDIKPGERWQKAIRNAIRDGDFFIACFSREYCEKKSFAHTELGIAIEELSKLPDNRIWFIPVRLNDCEIPDRKTGPGETLRDLQWVDLFTDWEAGINKILPVIMPGTGSKPAAVLPKEKAKWIRGRDDCGNTEKIQRILPSFTPGRDMLNVADLQKEAYRLYDGDPERFEKIRKILTEAFPEKIPASVPLQRPSRAEHFTGRQAELARLLHDLQPGRVVTICGPGGMGKSSLVAEALWTLAPGSEPPGQFPDGILFFCFYGQPQAAMALEAIARAYREEPKPTPALAAQRVLANRCALLVLDGAENADDLDSILNVRGRGSVLITTRRHQDAPAGWTDLSPLPEADAAALLRSWSGGRDTRAEIAEKICQLVGNLPLAIRLASRYIARTGQSAADYLAWLEKSPLQALDLGKRQRDSVPLLLERSADRVSEEARRVLGVAGLLALRAFRRELIGQALAADGGTASRLAGELVDYGLLLPEGESFHVSHALVHSYARERLSPARADELRRLATYFDGRARELSGQGLPGYAGLDPDRPHMLQVLAGCVAGEEWEAALSLSRAIEDYLDIRGYWLERVTAIEAGLAAVRKLVRRQEEGALTGNLGLACRDLGQVEKAIGYFEQALAIHREIGDRRGEGNRLGNLGLAFRGLGQVEKAIEYHEQALVISREIGDRRGEGNHLGNLGIAYSVLGQVEKAIGYYEQALAIAREIGDRRGEGNHLGNLGLACSDLGQVEKAIGYYGQALAIARGIGDRRGEGNRLGNLGTAYSGLGQVEKARLYWLQSLAIFKEIKSPLASRVEVWLKSLE